MRASRTRTLIRTSVVFYLAGTDLIFPMKKNLPYPHVRLIEGNIPATVRWPPFSCLGGRNADRRPTDDQLTRSTNHAHSLTRERRASENGGASHSYGSAASQRNMPCPERDHCSIQSATGRELCRPFPATAFGNHLSPEFHSVLSEMLWMGQMARQIGDGEKRSVFRRPSPRLLFKKEKSCFRHDRNRF